MEQLGDVLTTDGRTLDVWHVVGVCPLGSLLSAHLAPAMQISLAADQDERGRALRDIGNSLLHPVIQGQEGGAIGDIKDEDYTAGVTVVGLGNGSESILASSVPNLQL